MTTDMSNELDNDKRWEYTNDYKTQERDNVYELLFDNLTTDEMRTFIKEHCYDVFKDVYSQVADDMISDR